MGSLLVCRPTLLAAVEQEIASLNLPAESKPLPPLEHLRRAGWELDTSTRPAAVVDGHCVVVLATLDRTAVIEHQDGYRTVARADAVYLADDATWRQVETSDNWASRKRGRQRGLLTRRTAGRRRKAPATTR